MTYRALLLTLLLLTGAADASESCTLASIIGDKELSTFERTEPPSQTAREEGKFRLISLFCPATSIASDVFGYSALIGIEQNEAWVHQYGGYPGVSNWYGPIAMSSQAIANCINGASETCPTALIATEKK